jgi:hypothetical protein
MNLSDVISDVENKIDAIVQEAYPKELALLAEEVFLSMGEYPKSRGWSKNSENTHKRVGIAGSDHRNIDTGFLAEYASIPGNIVNDDWVQNMPHGDNYKYANELGRFDDIGRTKADEEYLEDKIVQAIVAGMS